jgi:ketosteroid isomerase-like protein
MNSVDVISAFTSAINRRSVNELRDLMTEDHCFVDSSGSELRGRDVVCAAWDAFFSLMPHYRITVEHVLPGTNMTAVFGVAEVGMSTDSTGHATGHFRLPAAWKVSLLDNRVAFWQVYADWSQAYPANMPANRREK